MIPCRVKDRIGQEFGRLKVVGFVRVDPVVKAVWRCECSCGNVVELSACRLRSGTQSCGCYRKEVTAARCKTHGFTTNRQVPRWYGIWSHMKDRCLNPENLDWKDYGGRGITVCDRWLDPKVFYEDMGDRPTSRHTLERLNNEKGYGPGNCSWETRKVQGRNKRSNVMVTFSGETKCVKEWAEVLGIPYNTLYMRLRLGWFVDKALTEMVKPGKPLRTRR